MCQINIKMARYIQSGVKGSTTHPYIELYEDYPTERKEQLNKREEEIIRKIGTLNKYIPCSTYKEYYDDNKIYTR